MMSEVSEISLHNLEAAPTPTRFTSTSLADFPMPQGREEAWRFTPIERLSGLLADTLDGGVATYRLGENTLQPGEPVTQGALRFTLAPHEPAAPLFAAPFDRAGAVGWNNIHQTLRINITGNVPEPVFLDITAGGEGTVGHIQIEAEEGSTATLVLRHTGSGELNETVEIQANRHATLNVLSLQEWETDAKHVATHQLRLAEGSVVQHEVVTLGGDTVRICSGVTLPEQHADINMLGLYFTNAGIHHEHRLFIDHIAAGSKSRVTYKGALQGRHAHAVWVGDVGIGPVAYATDSYESNRNLVLGKGPRVDSVPNLEIHNGQIEGAGHASATGRFDDEQLFYLMSRGIAPAEAKRLVVKAFYAELLNEMGVPELVEHVLKLVDDRLNEGSLQ